VLHVGQALYGFGCRNISMEGGVCPKQHGSTMMHALKTVLLDQEINAAMWLVHKTIG